MTVAAVVVGAALLLLDDAAPPPPDLALAFAASFWAFLASFLSSFLEGPFFSSASLIVAAVRGTLLCYCSDFHKICIVALSATWSSTKNLKMCGDEKRTSDRRLSFPLSPLYLHSLLKFTLAFT